MVAAGRQLLWRFPGTVEEATPVLEAALVRSDTLGKSWAVAELKNTQKQMKKYAAGKRMPHVIYHNWVVNTPLETGIAEEAKAKAAFASARTYENPFGVFVTGIDRTEEADSVVLKSRKKVFSHTYGEDDAYRTDGRCHGKVCDAG